MPRTFKKGYVIVFTVLTKKSARPQRSGVFLKSLLLSKINATWVNPRSSFVARYFGVILHYGKYLIDYTEPFLQFIIVYRGFC
jgi:hypothetical protein